MTAASHSRGDVVNNEKLTIRGHHLGCILAGFAEPTDHPTVPKAIEWLRGHPDGLVEVVVGPVDI